MNINVDVNRVSDYIDRIYQAILTPDDIPEIMSDLRSEVDAPYSSLQVEGIYNHSLDQAHLIDYDSTAINQYSDYFITLDPWTQKLIDRGAIDHPFQSAVKMVSDKDYRASEFYQDWGRQHGVRYAIGSGFKVDNQHILKLAFQRHCDHQAFADHDEQFLNLLHPHFGQWLRLSNLFKDQPSHHEQRDILDGMNRPVWLLSSDLTIKYSNKMAEQWLKQAHFVTLKDQKLTTRDYNQYCQLQQKVNALSTPEKQRLSGNQHAISLTDGNQSEMFWLVPVLVNHQRLVMLVGRKQNADARHVHQQFGISLRQAEISTRLSAGSHVAEIANDLNISVNTVRNQLSSSFRKLGIKNQSELVELIHHTCDR